MNNSSSNYNLYIARKVTLVIIWMFFYLITIRIINRLDYANFDMRMSSFFLSWLGIVLFLYVMYSWNSKVGNLFNPYSIFFLFLFLFNYGQPLMWAFGIHVPTELGGDYSVFSSVDIVKTQLYTLVSMLSFHIGALIVKSSTSISILDKPVDIRKSIWFIGVLLGTISIPLTFYRVINFYIVAAQYGYKALYYSSYAKQGGVLMIIEMFFMPSLVCMLIGSGYKKNVMRIIYGLFAFYLLINLLSGDRGSWIYKLFVFVWLHSVFVKPINFRKFIKYFLFSAIGLNLLAVITSLRDLGLQYLTKNYAKEVIFGSESPIVNNIFEMGGSMGILTRLISDDGVREAWVYGNTYFTALAGLISTRMLPVLGLDFVLVDNWFSQDYLGITWGTGFSMIGEAYLNAGKFFAPLIMIFIGYFIGKLLVVNQKTNPHEIPLRYVFVATSLNTFIGFARGSIYLYLKTWFYGTVITCILIVFLSNLIDKKVSVS